MASHPLTFFGNFVPLLFFSLFLSGISVLAVAVLELVMYIGRASLELKEMLSIPRCLD